MGKSTIHLRPWCPLWKARRHASTKCTYKRLAATDLLTIIITLSLQSTGTPKAISESIKNHHVRELFFITISPRRIIKSGVHLSCAIQRVWFHISNICHGLLGGLALAHLLFICTTKPYDWSLEGSIRNYAAFAEIYSNTFYCLAIVCMVSIFDRLEFLFRNH
jgi:Transmembrane protein 237